jgi:hypothetical protein
MIEVYKNSFKPTSGIAKSYWNTLQAKPGEYTVILRYGSLSEKTTAIVTEPWRWPVLNYRGNH